MDNQPVKTTVTYRLQEYLAIVQEYARYAIAGEKLKIKPYQVKEPVPALGWMARLGIRSFATLAFMVKSRRVGTCQFTFDETGLSRQCKTGEMKVAWNQVERVFRLREGYLFAKQSGGLPLPYRCLSAEDRAVLERYLDGAGHPC